MLRVIGSLHRRIGGRKEPKLFAPAFFLVRPIRSVLRVLPSIVVILAFARPALCQHWERLGPPGGMVISLAAASDGTVYLGTPDGHVFASADQGQHWELRGRAGDRLDGVVQRMVVDSRNPQRMLAAVWFRDSPAGGVFESADGAKTWKLAGLGSEAVRALEQSPAEPGVWVAGTSSGVFRSTDDTKSWQRISPAEDPELQNIDSLAIDPREAQTIYVGTYHLPWKTVDAGRTWHSISAGMIDDSDVMSLHIDSENPQRIFSSACSGIYRSEDGGASWTKLQGIPYSSRRTLQLAQDPAQAQTLYAATTEGVWMTSDSGETWKRITARDVDANAALVLRARTGRIVLAGTSARGILRNDNGGTAFVESNGGFAHRVVTAAAQTAAGRELLIQTEGSPAPAYSADGGARWTTLPPARPDQEAVRKVFFASAAWWAAFFDGGLAEFDSSIGRWRDVPFREVKKLTKTRRSPGKTTAAILAKPGLNFLVESGGRLTASSRDALWILDEKRHQFRKAAPAGLPFPVTYLSAGRADSLLAIAAGELWSNEGPGGWERVGLPAGAGALLWVQGGGSNPRMLLGTQSGVFAREKNAWRLLARGLPSIPSLAAACAESHCLVGMSNGGLYLSDEGLLSWRRVDSARERSKVSEILVEGKGTFLIGSEQEGMLRFVPED